MPKLVQASGFLQEVTSWKMKAALSQPSPPVHTHSYTHLASGHTLLVFMQDKELGNWAWPLGSYS